MSLSDSSNHSSKQGLQKWKDKLCISLSNWMLMWWSPMWWWNPAGKFQEISQNFLKMQSLTYFFFAWTFFLDAWTTCFEVRYPLVRVTSANIPHLVDYVIPKDERNFGASCSGNGNYIIIVAFVFPTITHNPIPVSIGMILHAICYVCMPLAHHKKKELLGWKSSSLEADRLRLENLIFSWSLLDKGMSKHVSYKKFLW